VKVGIVDIGTNSMRLLITDGHVESGRWVEVTGLGKGVDATGRLSDAAMDRTLEALRRFGERMTAFGVEKRQAVATSATRDASNRDLFLDRARLALGVRPDVISGDREGSLAYAGATSDLHQGDWVVSDIGGGSTEFVTARGAVSIDIGSVRLTDRELPGRPASSGDMERGRDLVRTMFADLEVTGDLIGVAGTWTSLAAIDLDLTTYDPARVHHHHLSRMRLDTIIAELAGMTVEETASIPSLDAARAPVILAGAVVASCVLEVVGVESILISECDTLDGLAIEVLDLA